MKKYFLFDLDGTLSDSAPGITKSVQYALEHFDIHVDDLNELRPFVGPPLVDSFMTFYGMSKEEADEAVKVYRERYVPIGIYENSIFPGIKHMLKSIKKNGGVLAVASGKPQKMVEIVLNHFGIRKYFDVCVGSDPEKGLGLISKEDIVNEALKQLYEGKEINYDECVMIGDRKFDVEGAHSHGIECVTISYDGEFLDELKEAGSDYIVFSERELEQLLLRGRKTRFFDAKKTDVSYRAPKIPLILYDLLMPILIYYLGSNLLRLVNHSLLQNAYPIVSGVIFLIMAAIMSYLFGYAELHNARYSYRFKNANMLRGADPIYRKNVFGALTLILIIVTSICFAFGVNIVFYLAGFFSKSANYQEVASNQQAVNLIEGILIYGLCSPIAEELVFRGIIYNRSKRYYSNLISGVISALFFGFYHGNIVQGTYGFLAGFLFAYIYEKSGSLLYAIMLHSIINLSGFALSNSSYLVGKLYNPIACAVFFIFFVASFFGAMCLEKKNRGIN